MANADRLIEVFAEAKARPAGAERDQFLAEACRNAPDLQGQVQSLLRAHDGAGDFLKNSQVHPAATLLAEKPGDRIGRYKLLQQIGEGGCGVVYMAEQEEPVRRRVALKVIKLGMDTRSVIARFEAERQALAMMDHPNIAKVFDAGVTGPGNQSSVASERSLGGGGRANGSEPLNTDYCPLITGQGRPYFVMELVRGIKITDYCDQNNLSTEERLKLFTQVCHAIQHAHQKGIIHRDIKPSNVLVTVNEPGSAGCPKVIDFGIAKATTGELLTDKTVFTAFEQFIGTPAYMSPEQAMMTSLDIDTRTDIYSLGVLLYELLTGQTPFDAREMMAAGLDAMRRIIREQEPVRPSTRLTTMLAADLTALARQRQAEPAQLGTLLRGDLDWIVMKCLEKDRGRRYESANDLALDLKRHLQSEPVLACPPSAAYRFRKFARRNKAMLAMAVTFGLAVLLTLVGLAVSNRMVTREKEKTEAALTRVLQEKERADLNLLQARSAVKEYLLKTSENPLLQTGDFQPLRKELMETAIPFYEEFVRQDQQNPKLEFERGRAYDDLGFLREGIGDQERALVDFEKAKEVFLRLAKNFPDKPVYRLRYAEGCNSRGGVLKDLSRLDAAEQEFRQALTVMGELLAQDKAPREYHETLARIQGNLGTLLRDARRLPEAESLLRQAVATREKLLEQNPDLLSIRGQLATSWNNLGTVLRAHRKAREAESASEKSLEILDPETVKRVANGAPEPLKFQHLRAQAWNNLGTMRMEASRFADAEKAFRESIAIKERLAEKFPSIPQHRQELAASFNNLGNVVSSLKRPDEARIAYEKATQLYERLSTDLPADPRYVVSLAGSYSNMGGLLGDQGQLEESLSWITKGIGILENAMRRDARVAKVRETLCIASWTRATTLCSLKRYSEAPTDWDRAIELDDGRYQLTLRIKRASNLLNLKDDVRATADAAAIAEHPSVTARDLYNAACVYGLSAQLAHEDGPRAEAHGKRAVALLRRAVAEGYKDGARFGADGDLKALRSRDDFQQLLKELDEGLNK